MCILIIIQKNPMKNLIFPSLAISIVVIIGSLSYVSNKEQSNNVNTKNPGYLLDYQVQKGIDKIENPAAYYADLLGNIKSTSQRASESAFIENINELGPENVGGRARALQMDLNDSNRIFAGSVSGGIWVSENKGDSWSPINDYASNLGVTSITQSPLNTNVLFYSTGEVRGNSANIFGEGVFKSIDGGKSFFHLAGSKINEIYPNTWKIVASPIDENTVYLATHTEGLVRSTDGGESFHLLLNGNITDVEVLPDGKVIVGSKGEGIFKSNNGNPGTFIKAESILPETGEFSRVELAFCESQPSTIYAAIVNKNESGLLYLFKSIDEGLNWSKVINPNKRGISFLFPWYCLALEVKPSDPNFVVIGSVSLGYSIDGGTTWLLAGQSHADYHIIKFDKNNEDRILAGNDGGLYEYSASTMMFPAKSLNNDFIVSQYYAGDYHPENDAVIGGTQDNGTNFVSVESSNFEEISGGDGGFSFIHQQKPEIAYMTSQNGYLNKTSNLGASDPTLMIIMNELDSNRDFVVDDGTWFINPFNVNPKNGDELFYTTLKRIWKSNNGGQNWTELTNEIGENRYKAPFALGLSNELEPKLYVAGSGGIFYRIDDATSAIPGDEVDLSESIPIGLRSDFFRNITVNPNDPSQLFVSLSNLSTKSRIFRVDFADTDSPVFIDISGDLPRNLPVNWVDVSEENPDFIIAGTDFGLYSTSTGGDIWNRVDEFPNVVIYQVKIRQSDQKLFVFTHGRGVWIADANTTVTGVENNEISKVSVYPNPATNSISLNNRGKKVNLIEIYNMQGQKVAEKYVKRVGESMDVSNLSSGTYLVKGTLDNKIVTQGRFVKRD
ncbi:MAG: hypothetical protein ACI9WO_001554 [Sphingobacteriales bacterium]|jgi:hypothetical protein